MRSTINSLYLLGSFLLSIFIPISLYLGTSDRSNPMEGIVAAAFSLIFLGSYLLYTILLGNRN